MAGEAWGPRPIGNPDLPPRQGGKIRQTLAVESMPLPVDPNSTAWIALVQAVLVTATTCLEPPAYFRE